METKMVCTRKYNLKWEYEEVENEDVRFFAYVKANKKMSKEMRSKAKEILRILCEKWTSDYDRFAMLSTGEFLYASLREIKLKMYEWLKEDEKKEFSTYKLGITAVAIFPQKRKSFWLNTNGDVMYYAEKNGDQSIYYLSSKKPKKIDIIANRMDELTDETEGDNISTPRAIIIVPRELKELFEHKGTVVQQDVEAYSYTKTRTRDLIYAEVFSS